MQRIPRGIWLICRIWLTLASCLDWDIEIPLLLRMVSQPYTVLQAVLRVETSQQEGPRFESLEFACSYHICRGLIRVLLSLAVSVRLNSLCIKTGKTILTGCLFKCNKALGKACCFPYTASNGYAYVYIHICLLYVLYMSDGVMRHLLFVIRTVLCPFGR